MRVYQFRHTGLESQLPKMAAIVAPLFQSSMIFSETRLPLFWIMLQPRCLYRDLYRRVTRGAKANQSIAAEQAKRASGLASVPGIGKVQPPHTRSGMFVQ